MGQAQYDYGMIGLGTMGRNLVLNMSDHGYSVAGFDKDAKQVNFLQEEGTGKNVLSTTNLDEFLRALKTPRVILMLVPAGAIVDEVINELRPLLSKGDLLLDCGNSHFTDTDRRIQTLSKDKLNFMGVGVSGGEAGARYGPSIMPGGSKEDYERVGPMLQSLAAKVDEQPCVAWLGNGSAGHYVKMVHNGIEYGLMQLIAETYHVLKVAGGLTNDELNLVFSTWNKGVLHSFLLEITTGIFVYKDEETGNRLLDMILDTAHQKGTGAWTSTSAMNLSVPIPTIDIAVTMRNISALKKQRELAEQQFGAVARTTTNHKKQLIDNMEQALYFASIVTYAQGMALLTTASQRYGYGLQLAEVAKIWRGGCIIRAALLEKIKAAYGTQPELSNLLMNDSIAAELNGAENGIRKAITTAVESSIPVPALMASLGYFDAFRSAWLPANLVQAQRDFFGAHKYERTDKTGEFHTDWTHKTNGHGDK